MDSIIKGFETKEVTLYCDETVNAKNVVMLERGYSVCIPAEGEPFCGLCTNKNDTYASVVLKGVTEVPYSGSAPSVGYAKLSSDGAGAVKADDTNGREYLVISVNSGEKTLEIML